MTIFFLFFLILSPTSSVNVLVYSPAFAASHTNFMARLADTLTESGHNVTFLVPIIDSARRNQLGVRVTTDVLIVDSEDNTVRDKDSLEAIERYWTEEPDSSNVQKSFKWFFDAMAQGCDNFLRHSSPQIIDQLKSRRFDVAIVEAIAVCGLGFVRSLGIEKTILASSCVHFDWILKHIGEPEEHSYLPSLVSRMGEEMSIWERYENYRIAEGINLGFTEMFDVEQKILEKHLGGSIPNWRELLPAASLYFTNSNPYVDFPRLTIPKTVPIGGISVSIERIKAEKLDEKWGELLNKRKYNMLISFGSMLRSEQMPDGFKKNIVNVIKSEPNVTFIWKYETDETSFAEDVDNVFFSKWVPQTALLGDDRMTAFLTHGGLGSTNELAHCGKPAVMIPVFGDQYRNARMLERHGGVVVVSKMSLGEWDVVKNAVHSTLYDERIKKNAAHLAELLQNQPAKPRDLVVKYTEFVARYGPFPQMDPFGRKLNFFQRALLDVFLIETLVYLLYFFVFLYIIPFQLTKLFIKRRRS